MTVFFTYFWSICPFLQRTYFQRCSDIQSTYWFTEKHTSSKFFKTIRFLFNTLKTETETHFSSLTLQVHRKIREDSDMAQDSLQCLAQLASMHGPIFPDESAQVSYLAHLVEGLLSMINGSVCHCAGKQNLQIVGGSELISVLCSVLCGSMSYSHTECTFNVFSHASS